MKYSKNIMLAGTVFLAGIVFGILSHRPKQTLKIEERIDTVIMRDTLYFPEPVPVRHYLTHVDTVWLASGTDTVRVEVPVERKEYRTDDFHAVVSGYSPELVSMQVFPQTRHITHTEVRTVRKTPRWGVGVQVGGGIAGNELKPYIGIGLQYNLFTF